MEPAEAKKECEDLKTESALPKIIVEGYKILNLIRYFTCGPDEVRAWTIRKGTKAPDAAGVIHTDFKMAFIKGNIMHYNDLFEYKSEVATKAHGKLLQMGKEYEVEDGDICHWMVGTVKN